MTRPGETPGRFRFDMDTTKRRTLNVLGVGLIVAMCVVVALLLQRSRERAIADLQRDTKNLTTALAQYSRGTVTSVDLALIGARDSLARLELSEPAPLRSELGNQVLRGNVARIGLPVLMRVLDQNGYELFSSDAQPFTTASNDRDYFRAHVARDVGLFISQPFVSRINGKWAMVFSRRLNGLNGQFVGVILLGIPMEVFEDLFALFEVGPRGTLILADDQGTLFARRPAAPALIGKKVLRDDGALNLLRTGTDSGVRINQAPIDGLDRMLGFERVAATRLVVGVGQSVDDWLADWRRDAIVSGSVTLLLGGLALLMLIQTARHARDTAARGAQLESANDELQRRVDVDTLTELPNRLRFEDRLAHVLARDEQTEASTAERGQRKLAVLFIDLDGFRSVNDSFGHAAGDIVLKEAASRLRNAAHDGDTVARVGGDGFLLLMESVASTAECVMLARRLIEALERPFDVLSRQVELSGSVGIAVFPDHGRRSELVVHAEAAMYAAKRSGGGSCALFDLNMESGALEQLDLLNDLRHAVDLGQLALHYQPKVDGQRGQIRGVEALLRWHHPQRGTVSPAVFIPIAERFGLIQGIGNWVIDEACRQMQAWADVGVRMRVAINVSAQQLRKDDLVARIEHALARHQLEASQLLCEITESVAMEDIKSTQRAFDGLERIGVYLSIDDFGTGYSSLSYLRQLPAKQLKIDRSFVNDLESSSDARAIVDAVVRLAHALGLRVVAEGVETGGQRDFLLQLGCDELQGYFFAKPMPADALLAWAVGRKPEGAVDFSPSVVDDTLSS